MARLDRLKELATVVLPVVPDERFDLKEWQEDSISCGTVACAVGWACHHPPFVEQGLTMELDQEDLGWNPSFGEYVSWGAVEEFFEVEHDDAAYLFSIDTYDHNPSKQEVIDRVLAFVKEREPVKTPVA